MTEKLNSTLAAMDLYLLSMDLYGVPPERVPCVTCGAPHGTPCNDATHDNVTEQLMAMQSFGRVGSTDLCVKCLLTRGSSECACPPEERFFADLTAKSGTEVKMPPDYRFPVLTRCETGQLPADPRAFSLQEPEPAPKPRGGFEFL